MTSLWLEDHPPIESDVVEEHECDDVVVGAGLTGVVTALLLARAGRDVVVLEAREPAAVATGNTTAKVSLLQGTRYSDLMRHHAEDVVRAYVEGNLEGQQWLLRFCESHDLPVDHRRAATYAVDDGESEKLARAEHAAASRLGLLVRWEQELPVPFPHVGATVLDDQLQIQPVDVLTRLIESLRAEGGRLVTGTRVDRVDKVGAPTVHCADGRRLRCTNLVLATGTPVLDRSLSFATQAAERSYALAYRHPDPPELMLISAGDPTRSVRDAAGPDGGPRLVVGGEGHPVGRTRSELAHLNRLREWTADYFPEAVETNHWSAQDYRTADGLPYVGRLRLELGNVYTATGYAKWGMTNAVAAALRLSARILGGKLPWADRMDRRTTRPSALAHVAQLNAGVVAEGVRTAVTTELRPLPPEPPAEGEGVTGRAGLRPVGRSTVDGQTCAVQAVCTHLGGVLRWNDAECSWDCPLHGSRFSPTGEVLEGPATRPLRRL